MPELTDEDRDAIRARAEAATPGPWHHDHVGDYGAYGCAGHGNYGWVTGGPNGPAYDEDTAQGHADAEFIAHARTDIPRLLARLTEVEGRYDALLRETEWWLAEIDGMIPVVGAAKAWRLRVSGLILGDHEVPLRDAVDALQEGPSGPLYANLSPSEPELVPLTTDGVGEQGETQEAREHRAHLTDGHWHDDCSHCLRRRESGGTGADREQIPPSSLHSEGGSGRGGDYEGVVGIDFGCPKCQTILNAKAANCDGPWHADNAPADPPWPEEAYEAGRAAYDSVVIAHGAFGHRAGHYDAIIAAIRAALPLITRGVRRDELQTAARTLLAEARAYAEKWAPKDEMWDRGYAAGMEAAAHTVANSIDRERAARRVTG